MGFEPTLEKSSTLVIRDGLHALILSLCSNIRTLEIELDILGILDSGEDLSYEPLSNVTTLCRPVCSRLSSLVHSALTGNELQQFSRLEQLDIRSVPPFHTLDACPAVVDELHQRLECLTVFKIANPPVAKLSISICPNLTLVPAHPLFPLQNISFILDLNLRPFFTLQFRLRLLPNSLDFSSASFTPFQPYEHARPILAPSLELVGRERAARQCRSRNSI